MESATTLKSGNPLPSLRLTPTGPTTARRGKVWYHLNVPSENDDFHVDLTFSGEDRHHARLIAGIVAAVAILFMVATMTTNLATHLLPMEDRYMQILVPVAADGGEPLSLKTLDHQITGNTISVRGTIVNRTEYPVSDIVAVVEMQDTTGRFPQTVEVPIRPQELPPQVPGEFMTTATLQEKPAGYLVKFRLADGPFVPHKDDRAATFGVTVK